MLFLRRLKRLAGIGLKRPCSPLALKLYLLIFFNLILAVVQVLVLNPSERWFDAEVICPISAAVNAVLGDFLQSIIDVDEDKLNYLTIKGLVAIMILGIGLVRWRVQFAI